MIRTFLQTKGGLGELTLRPETDEEREQLATVCPPPPAGVPAGVLCSYDWNERGQLVLFTRPDPNYVAPAPTPPAKSDSAVIDPVPPRERLLDWKAADLITKGAELGLQDLAGQTKAAMVAKIIPAWAKRNEELAKGPPA